MRHTQAFVCGAWVGHGSDEIQVLDPSTDDDVVATAPMLDRETAQRAVASARAGFHTWRTVPLPVRAEILAEAGRLVLERSDELSADLVAESGKPIREAIGEIAKTASTFRYYAGQTGALDGRSFAGGSSGLRHETRLEPVGIVALITPWNVPSASPARKLAPALLAGNAVILKPSSLTPISAFHLVRCLVDAGVAPQAIQLLFGDGEVVGQTLAEDPRIGAVSFTGSTEVGLGIRARLGRSLTRSQLELGGKNAAIVMPDADLRRAAAMIVTAAFTTAGQQCTATSRVIVHADVQDALLDELRIAIGRIVVGPTRDPDTTMGPLISQGARSRVVDFVDRAIADGARLELGGSTLGEQGHYYAPTLLSDVRRGTEIAMSEVFGPVLAVIRVDSLDAAIDVLNETPYGLSSAIHTSSLTTAERVAAEADTGIVAVNGATAGVELSVPFGGFKASGTDSKEHASEALRFYTRQKSISWA